jgi:hypothetical protein
MPTFKELQGKEKLQTNPPLQSNYAIIDKHLSILWFGATLCLLIFAKSNTK